MTALFIITLITQLMDTAAWGTMGFVVFRLLGGHDSRWYLGVLLTLGMLGGYEALLFYGSGTALLNADPGIRGVVERVGGLSPPQEALGVTIVILSLKSFLGFMGARFAIAHKLGDGLGR